MVFFSDKVFEINGSNLNPTVCMKMNGKDKFTNVYQTHTEKR